jgi:enoyl-[acyl-carrier protein] reductase III
MSTNKSTAASNDLSGKIALVTGGSRGIGKAIAFELGQRGATIAINYLKNHKAAQATVYELEAAGISATRIKAHVGDETAVESLVEKIDEKFGRLDILINNAASGVMRPATELSVKHWNWTLDINARGPWLLAKAAARLMPEASRIINVSSPGSTRVLPAYFAVGVSKAAIEAVTRYLAVELGPKGIAVNTVSAGFVMTDAIEAFPDELGIKDIASRATPAGRVILPKDVAKVVAMMCGTDAEMIRGQVIMVDGGETLCHQ